jgi:predicted ATPase
LGYPDQALKRSREALVLAQELDHPLTLGFALAVGGSSFHLLRRESQAAQDWAEDLMLLATQKDLALFQAWGAILLGRGQVEQGQVEEGLAHIHQGLAAWQATGTQAGRPHHLLLLAEAYRDAHHMCGRDGQAGQGLNALDEALALVEESGGRYFEAEIYRLKGELLLAQAGGVEMLAAGPNAQSRQKPAFIAEATASYRRAIEVARRQQAKSWELRATTSLARLLQWQGQQAEARQRLAEIYDWFSEGWDTPDLQEARGLLEELAGK